MAIKKKVITKSTPATKSKPAVRSAPKAAKESSSRSSLASLFDDTDSSEATNFLSEGPHTVRLNSIEIKDDPKKGAGAFVEYESIDGDEEGKKIRQMYKLTDADGGKASGMAYLKRDLALMGQENVSGGKLKAVLNELSEEQPMCVINVKQNGQYTNAYLQGLAENVEADADGDGKPAEETELAVGDRVSFEHEGDTIEGEIRKIKGDEAKIKSDDGEDYEVDLADLTIVEGDGAATEQEEEGAGIEVGSSVTFDDDGTERTGEVTKINIKKGVATVIAKDDDDDDAEYEVDMDDLALAEGADGSTEAEAEIEVGSRVTWTDEDGDDHEGEVVKIKGDKVTVNDDDDDRHVVEKDDLTLVD